jgi:hypothetical protein
LEAGWSARDFFHRLLPRLMSKPREAVADLKMHGHVAF